MSTYEELGLITAHDEKDALNYPGSAWPEFTEPFGRTAHSIKMLGGIAATILLETRQETTTFNHNIRRFAEAARPPIQQAFLPTFIEGAQDTAFALQQERKVPQPLPPQLREIITNAQEEQQS